MIRSRTEAFLLNFEVKCLRVPIAGILGLKDFQIEANFFPFFFSFLFHFSKTVLY